MDKRKPSKTLPKTLIKPSKPSKPRRLSKFPTLKSPALADDMLTPRPTRRPTVAVAQMDPIRVQEVLLGIFRLFDYNAIDMEALIYFALQSFKVTPATYEDMYKIMQKHIMKNFAINQGNHVRLQEVHMRRLIVCYTVEKDKE